MIIKKVSADIIHSAVKAETEFKGIKFVLYVNGIYHVKIPQMKWLSMDVIHESVAFLQSIGQEATYNIFEFEAYADIDSEVRIWAADKESVRIAITDAIVINNFSQKIITDFYININRPRKLTRVFYSMSRAVDWTYEKMAENN